MKYIHSYAAIAILAAGTTFPAAAVEVDTPPPAVVTDGGAQQRETGSVAEVNRQQGLVTLSSPNGLLKLHFPPAAVHDLKPGDRITAQYTLAKADRDLRGGVRAYDAPYTRSEQFQSEISRGQNGGTGTTHDVGAAGPQYGSDPAITNPQPSGVSRGPTGGAGTTHDLAAEGHRFSERDAAPGLSTPDTTRGLTGGVGPTHDLTAAGGRLGEHRMTGTISQVDRDRGMIAVRTSAGELQLHVTPQVLHNLSEGETITVQLAFIRET